MHRSSEIAPGVALTSAFDPLRTLDAPALLRCQASGSKGKGVRVPTNALTGLLCVRRSPAYCFTAVYFIVEPTRLFSDTAFSLPSVTV